MMRNEQSSRAVPETGVDSGVASASVRPEPIDVAAWRGAMEGVTPGPWGFDGLRVFFRRVSSVIARCRFRDSYVPLYEATAYKNAAWIARCSPAGISTLLDALDEAMAALREKEERVKALEEALGISTDALDGLGNASDAHVSPEVWRLHGCEYAVTSARSVLSSVQPVSGSREQRGNEEG